MKASQNSSASMDLQPSKPAETTVAVDSLKVGDISVYPVSDQTFFEKVRAASLLDQQFFGCSHDQNDENGNSVFSDSFRQRLARPIVVQKIDSMSDAVVFMTSHSTAKVRRARNRKIGSVFLVGVIALILVLPAATSLLPLFKKAAPTLVVSPSPVFNIEGTKSWVAEYEFVVTNHSEERQYNVQVRVEHDGPLEGVRLLSDGLAERAVREMKKQEGVFGYPVNVAVIITAGIQNKYVFYTTIPVIEPKEAINFKIVRLKSDSAWPWKGEISLENFGWDKMSNVRLRSDPKMPPITVLPFKGKKGEKLLHLNYLFTIPPSRVAFDNLLSAVKATNEGVIDNRENLLKLEESIEFFQSRRDEGRYDPLLATSLEIRAKHQFLSKNFLLALADFEDSIQIWQSINEFKHPYFRKAELQASLGQELQKSSYSSLAENFVLSAFARFKLGHAWEKVDENLMQAQAFAIQVGGELERNIKLHANCLRIVEKYRRKEFSELFVLSNALLSDVAKHANDNDLSKWTFSEILFENKEIMNWLDSHYQSQRAANLIARGDNAEAIKWYEKAIQIAQDNSSLEWTQASDHLAIAKNNLAWLISVASSKPEARTDGKQVEYAEWALNWAVSNGKPVELQYQFKATLAVAHASMGDFGSAARIQQELVESKGSAASDLERERLADFLNLKFPVIE